MQRWNEQMERAAVRGRVDDEGLPEVLVDPPGLVARRLDEWVVRHREAGIRSPASIRSATRWSG